jgi:flagellar basal body-associated protein FliL
MADLEKKNLNHPPKRRSGRVLFVIAAVVLAGIGIWFAMHRGNEADAASVDTPVRVKSTLHLETFVLNLSDSDQRSYLRVGIDLGFGKETKRGEDQASIAEVRDTILGVLAQGKVEDLLTAAGKTKLKENLLQALQQRMPQLGVEEVYFTEFLIQR